MSRVVVPGAGDTGENTEHFTFISFDVQIMFYFVFFKDLIKIGVFSKQKDTTVAPSMESKIFYFKKYLYQ